MDSRRDDGLRSRGRIVPRARLAAALLHGQGQGLGARSVDVYIHRLRARLREVAAGHRLAIEAVRGRGYALCEIELGLAADNAARDAA